MVNSNVETICILTAANNYTSNFSYTPFDQDYYTSSKASLMAPSNQSYLARGCIFLYLNCITKYIYKVASMLSTDQYGYKCLDTTRIHVW